MCFLGFGVWALVHRIILLIEIKVRMRPEPGSLLTVVQTASQMYKWINSLAEKDVKEY